MDGYSYVPAAQVLPFNFIKKPIISALWYSALSVLLIQNDTISYLIGTAFFILRCCVLLTPSPMLHMWLLLALYG